MDNGTPWRSRGDLPTDLEPWLAGLGVGAPADPPRRPQDNGVVERPQGTGERRSEPHRAATSEELRVNLEMMDRRRREAYPHGGQASRRAASPALAPSGRDCDVAREGASWGLERARGPPAGFVVMRRVDQAGMVSPDDRDSYVGKAHAGHDVRERYDPSRGLWRFRDGAGHQVHQRGAAESDAGRIRGLTATRRRVRPEGGRGGNSVSRLFRHNLMLGDSTP